MIVSTDAVAFFLNKLNDFKQAKYANICDI